MIVSLPIFLPLSFMIFAFLFRHYRGREYIAVAAAFLNVITSILLFSQTAREGMLKLQMGDWPAPYGITLVSDRFSAFMVLIASLIFLATTAYSVRSVDWNRKSFGYYLFSFGVLMGVNGSFLAGDIFNLYVWFEVMLMASFILMSHGGERQQLEGSIKYLILNLISSFFFVAGIGLLYGKIGSLNMADIASKLMKYETMPPEINPAFILIFVGFAIKGALVPFFFWLPASYHTPPPVVTALFSGLLTKVGIYSLIRFYSLFLYQHHEFWQPLILGVAVLSMVIGVITATSQFEFRKILSFHIISQVGYVVMGLGLYTIAGLAGAIYFLAHNMLSKTNAFLVAGYVYHQKGTLNLKILGGFYKKHPLWAIFFFISAFSLAGLPPLSGFVGKFLLIKAGIEADHLGIALIALFVGFFTLFSMVKIWIEVFWKPEDNMKKLKRIPQQNWSIQQNPLWMTLSSGGMALLIVLGGIFASPIVDYCYLAAESLMNPQLYVDFVLN
ncbi:proton-conducting transporter transmembrane domain-containing protein [Thermophagus xiamenensis]|uniref:Multisubunit sodium/proton antiporter, MrpD subunit n=1 Tax=Thermophagus xiamenensis TaxID=385682 RepID=A0A1I2BPZ7_9BACT|nr:proton-conducting transporter membrane subunit [Thermophagus xiamenensis]SFE58204.1 multisubunit sodium/proton antiporter, MrpD subunit [Thermophagus xiamenensis]